MTTDLLAGLDDDQRTAVTAPAEPLCIFAGAGSGKTRVLTHRIAWQIQEEVVTPDRMFVSAFTKAASTEMAERVVALTDASSLEVGTFHSIMFRLLNTERDRGGKSRLNVCREGERKRILRDLLGKPSRDFPQALNLDADLAVISSRIGTWKNNLIQAGHPEILNLIDESARTSPEGAAARVYQLYEAHLRSIHKVDFDDMLLLAHDLLDKVPEVRSRWQQRWGAFFIDEAQDTNIAQWSILELLAPPETHPNVTVVGDTRQALYRFRGAVPESLDDFEKIYPGAKRIDLRMNYRSTQEVINVANRLVKNFELPDQVASREAGVKTVVVPFDDPLEQAIEIAKFIGEARRSGRKGSEMAVTIRTNAQSAPIEQAFVAARLPYWCQGGGFFDRMEIGDMMAYLRLADGRNDEASLRRIINRPTRYLGEAFCDAVVMISRRHEGDLVTAMRYVTETRGRALSPKQREAAIDLANLLDSIGGKADQPVSTAPSVCIQRVLDWTEYFDWLRRNEGTGTDVDDSRKENIEALREVAFGYSTISQLIEFADATTALQVQSGDATEICTVHRSKGREWPIVLVSNFFDDSMPHKRAVAEGFVNDERRVAYVAFTRARDLLVVCVPGQNEKAEAVRPSRFLRDAGFDFDPEEVEIEDKWWGSFLD